MLTKQRLYGTARSLAKVAVGGAIVAASFAALLYSFQDKIIYINRKYNMEGDRYYRNVLEKVQRIRYGDSTSFFLPPASIEKKKEKMWILFGGNAALALDWYDFCVAAQRSYPHYSFLLYEYDGYGLNSNTKPSPETIDRSMKLLYETFVNEREENIHEVNLLGHSLGSAAALRFAANNEYVNVKKVICLSPFTSMLDMAKVVLGPLPGIEALLKHRWNNIESLERLRQRKTMIPKIFIAHGTRDGIVPFDQGKKLYEAALSTGIDSAQFLPVTDANHNDILSRSFGDILRMMENDDETDSCDVVSDNA